MITPMKKVTVLTLAGRKEETLKALREMEIIHLTPLQTAAGAAVNGAKGAVARVQKAMEVVPDKVRKGVTPASKGASGVTLVEEIQTLISLPLAPLVTHLPSSSIFCPTEGDNPAGSDLHDL